MSKCKDCMLCNGLCIGGMGMSVLDQIDSELRLKKPYPSKIIFGQDVFDILRQEIRRTDTVSLTANPSGKYPFVKLFGMDIEIDEYCRFRIAYGYTEKP
ncbi:MAG: hypothetical protein K2J67_05920 [Lachnospiraceae bacterium]|nr:hypothetical protein [Lachnospiraceae bacterium]